MVVQRHRDAAASARAGSDRERDSGQLFGDCPEAALDGRVVGLPAGVGQLLGLGLAACEQGRRVRYITTAALVNEFAEATSDF
jgi:hypothetical protein